jgi:hypothetical protein
MNRCRLKRYNFQIKNNERKQDNTSIKRQIKVLRYILSEVGEL